MNSRTETTSPDLDLISHVPADVVDHHALRTSFTDAVLRLSTVNTGQRQQIPSSHENNVLLGWADALAPRHGGAHALLSANKTQLRVQTELGDGRTVDATFYREAGQLSIDAVISPRGTTNRIMFTNPDPKAVDETIAPSRSRLRLFRRGARS